VLHAEEGGTGTVDARASGRGAEESLGAKYSNRNE
jgi:hypothetical protein